MSMRYALHAEWTKLRTTRGTVWLLLAVIGLTAGVSALAAATFKCRPDSCTLDLAKISFTGVQLGQAVVAILAVLAISGEFSTGMIRTTLTAMPRRVITLAAKAILLIGIVVTTATVAVVLSLWAGERILPGLSSLDDALMWRVAVGSVLYLGLIALLSLGIATAVRDSATAIGIVLGLLYVFPIIAQMVSDKDWQRHLLQVGPTTAGLAIQATTDLGNLPISPWAGLGVLAAWAAAALFAGGLLLERRDA